ncbi:DUF4148 domain-containing protein [Burkholderia gladioli]|uniref:DUF4148 domain-containing protein n=1 Tax=Burkholderia gladioli TaxID=28095 RepID=UPI001640005E|nr:DUF4148 domain-containing protein [Burkholderia gladioli]MDA0570454.1 DUF4148 domain-containing protein [Burkholderia gladioli]MDA0598485.1 DUF4148 domain-containing protein [Burkholderia gladioli]
MKVSKIALSFALAASFVAASSAFAAMPAQSAPAQDSVQTQVARAMNHPLTRAEVRAQLVEAQKDGQLAALQDLYRGS